MESISLDPVLMVRILLLGGIGMSIFLIFASELKGGAPGLNSVIEGIAVFVYQLRGKHHDRDKALQRSVELAREFFMNVVKMTLVGFAAALLSTMLLYLAFRFGHLIDTTCWFDSCR